MTRYYLYDSVTDTVAEFAKKKDNRKRNAALGSGAVVVGGAGIRYGGAAAKTALANRRLYNGAGGDGLKGQRMNVNTQRDAMSGGARGQLNRDIEYIKSVPGRVKSYPYGEIPGRAKSAAGNAYGRAKSAVSSGYGRAKGAAGKGYNLAKAAAMGQHGLKGRLALAGAGLGAAALTGGAAYGGKKLMDRRRKNKSSIRNRVRALLGR